jgi:hypothetical protein
MLCYVHTSHLMFTLMLHHTCVGVFNETTFRGIDYVLAQAGRYGIKAIVTLNNFWEMHDSVDNVRHRAPHMHGVCLPALSGALAASTLHIVLSTVLAPKFDVAGNCLRASACSGRQRLIISWLPAHMAACDAADRLMCVLYDCSTSSGPA